MIDTVGSSSTVDAFYLGETYWNGQREHSLTYHRYFYRVKTMLAASCCIQCANSEECQVAVLAEGRQRTRK